MDHFGIGAGVIGAANVYFQGARRTGRTTVLVESVKDGDRIVFTNAREADRVGRLLKERGVDVQCLVIDPATPQRVFEYGTSAGRTIFDHSWVEQHYLIAINEASSRLDHFEREVSGYGEAHRDTRRRAEEIAKWRNY